MIKINFFDLKISVYLHRTSFFSQGMVVGGSDANNAPTSIVELYYPASQCTVRLHDTPVANTNPILCLINDVVYLGIESYKITMYTYDFTNDNWINLGLGAVSTYDHPRAGYACGDSYLCVASDDNPECFFPGSNTWSNFNYINTIAGAESCVVLNNDILYSFGGDKTSYNNKVQYLDLIANKWTLTAAAMPAYTAMGGCHLIPGTNQILVTIAGTSPNACTYNTNTNSFESCTNSQVVLSQSDVVASCGLSNQMYAFDFTTPKYIGAYAYCPSSASPWQKVALGSPITERYYFSVVSFSCSLIPAGKFPVSCNPVDYTCV
jgi:hypothetical protein